MFTAEKTGGSPISQHFHWPATGGSFPVGLFFGGRYSMFFSHTLRILKFDRKL